MNLKNTFIDIYEKNRWGDPESVSGPGSTLEYTQELRKNLSDIIKKFSINTIFDAPCGDFNWMQDVIEKNKINYIGGDIVEKLILKNIEKYQTNNINFKEFDITKDKFPKADLWICRDCFFHLSEENIFDSLKNYVESDIPYFFTTTHVNNMEFKNKDIISGGFRKIDLFSPPYNFPTNVLYKVNDFIQGFPEREMILLTKEQVSTIIK